MNFLKKALQNKILLLYLHSQNQNNDGGACITSVDQDSVAQLVEHYTFNVGVLGSSPSGIT